MRTDRPLDSVFGEEPNKKTDPLCESVLELVGDEGFEPPTLSV